MIFIKKYLVLLSYVFLFTHSIFAIQLKSQSVFIGEAMVGKEIATKFLVVFPDSKISQIDFSSIDVRQLENSDIKVMRIHIEDKKFKSSNDDSLKLKIPNGSFPYEIEMQLIAKRSGLLEIPNINISIYEISFPFLHVEGGGGEDMSNIIPVFTYVPLAEIIQLLLWGIASVLGLIFVIKLCIPILQIPNKYFYLISNSNHLRISIKTIHKIEVELKRMGKKGVKKFLLTKECYERLISVIRKSVNYLYQSNKGDSSTPEELYALFRSFVSLNQRNIKEISSLFETFDTVLYGKKKISVNMRIQHCVIAKNLLKIAYANHVQNNRVKSKRVKQGVF